jgi:hypothetical protein
LHFCLNCYNFFNNSWYFLYYLLNIWYNSFDLFYSLINNNFFYNFFNILNFNLLLFCLYNLLNKLWNLNDFLDDLTNWNYFFNYYLDRNWYFIWNDLCTLYLYWFYYLMICSDNFVNVNCSRNLFNNLDYALNFYLMNYWFFLDVINCYKFINDSLNNFLNLYINIFNYLYFNYSLLYDRNLYSSLYLSHYNSLNLFFY